MQSQVLQKCFCKWLVPLIVFTCTLDATGKGTNPCGIEFKTPGSVTSLTLPTGHVTGPSDPLQGVGEAVVVTGSASCHFHLCHSVLCPVWEKPSEELLKILQVK